MVPHAQFGARNVGVLDDQQRVAEYRVRSFDYGVDFGREFGNWGEIRAGVRRDDGSSRVRIGDPDAADGRLRRAVVLHAAVATIELDNVNFPRHGTLASLEWRTQNDDQAGRTIRPISSASTG